MLGEDAGQSAGVVEGLEVVTVCDHLLLLASGQTKAEVVRKAASVPLHCLVQRLRGDPVEPSEVGVYDHREAPKGASLPAGVEWLV